MGTFTSKEKEFGCVKVESGTVFIYESMYQRRAVNTPCGPVKDAYWQNGVLHIVMVSGRHFTYNKTDSYDNFWYE